MFYLFFLYNGHVEKAALIPQSRQFLDVDECLLCDGFFLLPSSDRILIHVHIFNHSLG